MPKRGMILFALVLWTAAAGEQSFFSPEIAQSRVVREAFAYLDQNRDRIVAEWTALTEIPAPSGQERRRAVYLKAQFEAAGMAGVRIDAAGNVIGMWKGSGTGKRIAVSAHMDTVFQGVSEIKVTREGRWLKAPGIGDDTASLINLLWTVRALAAAHFAPASTYYFLATVREETGLAGMRAFLKEPPENIDMVIALDDDLGKIHYGALGLGGGKVVFRGPGAHTMQSRGIPNPNLAVAKAIQRIYEIPLPSQSLEKWTVLNIGQISGGKVTNAVSQESSFTIDLRSADQEELDRVREDIGRIVRDIAKETGTTAEIALRADAKVHKIPGAADSSLVKTLAEILRFLGVREVEVDPLGSTEANAGIERGILSVNAGRTYGNFKHSLNEEADIDGLFLAQRQLILFLASLK
jgi:tripeptide aminopeptidase